MKIFLSGHEGSKKIIPASSFLVSKYLPGFSVKYLNYGQYNGPLHGADYVNLKDKQDDVSFWAADIAYYLNGIDDDLIIFALDDYLLSAPLDVPIYERLLDEVLSVPEIVCARLCQSDFYRAYEWQSYRDGLIILADEAEYSATTQYCIWDRRFLIDLLRQVKTPWEFEITGSRILKQSGKKVIGSTTPALRYPDASSLSSKWRGRVRVVDNRKEDIDYLVKEGHLDERELVR